jgi:hypothetical protein
VFTIRSSYAKKVVKSMIFGYTGAYAPGALSQIPAEKT